MRVLVSCPDCDGILHEIVAIPSDQDDAKSIDPGDLLNAPGNNETWGWCPKCERTWNISVKYDEVLSRTDATK